jgi:lysine biosynthesis protein LysW
MIAVACPICESILEVEEPGLDARVTCPDCGEAWVVASLDPPRLVYAYDIDEEDAGEPDEDHPRAAPG